MVLCPSTGHKDILCCFKDSIPAALGHIHHTEVAVVGQYLSSKQNPEETVLDFVDRVSQKSTFLEKEDAADIIL